MSRVPYHARGVIRNGKSGGLAAGVAVGAALASTALLVWQAARRAEQRHPASGRFMEVDGVRLHYYERGEGEPVVLLHGNRVLGRDFIGSGVANLLASHHRVIIFDRPGFGYSKRPRTQLWTPDAQAKLLLTAFARLGIHQPVVVGHSWGTLVALSLAMQAPDALRGLLLVSGYYYPTVRPDSVMFSGPAIPVLGDVLRYTIAPLLDRYLTPRFVRLLFAPQSVPAAFYKEVPLELMLRPWQIRATAADAALMVPAVAGMSRHYRQMQLPVTLVAGSDDAYVDWRAHSARLHRELPRSSLLVVPGVGHMLHYAVPEQLALAVEELFAHPQPAPEPRGRTSGQLVGARLER